MANVSESLEERLEELGNSLASPPDSSEELVSLLDLADELLSRVEQSPSQSMLTRLKPLMSTLVAKELLRHSDTDVKAAVASCISEITRITAPEAPYEDEIMKEIFQMIVGAFEGLHDTSNRSFTKRVSVLETVAKVRSCVVMLDLECDALILEMFHHFLNTIRSNHSENVYSAMETIMTLVIEESEEISLELLSCLLIVVKKDNKDVLPIARKLVEQVIGGCANKLKPYLLEFVQSTGALLSDYSKVVSSICQQSSDAVENNEINTLGEIVVEDSKLSERTVSDEMFQEQEIGCPEKVGIVSENSQKEALNNGTVQVGNSDAIAQPPSPKQKPERSCRNGPSVDAVDASLADCDNPEPVAVKSDGSLDLNRKNVKGRKSSSAQLTDTTDNSRVGSDKETPAVSSKRKSHSKEAEPSEIDDLSAKEEVSAGPLDPEKKNEHNSVLENTSTDGASQNPSESLREAIRSKRGRPSRRKAAKQNVANAVAGKSAASCSQKDALGNSQTQDDATPSKNDGKEPEGISRSEGKSERRSGKKIQLDVAAMDEEPATVASDTEVKPQRQMGKKGLKRKVIERDISGKKHNSNIKQKGEVAVEDDVPGKPSLKEDVSSPGTPSKVPNIDQSHLDDSKKPPATSRKRFRGTENVLIPETSDHKEEYGDNIVGLKIKVWWPDDKKFYDGAITSFDHTSKMHKVVYTDGDVEVLLLKNERWKFAGGNTKIDGGKEKDIQGTDTSQMIRSKASRGTSNSLSKQPKTPSHSKSGNESSDNAGTKPRGRPRSGASNLEKSDDSPSISKKSKGRVVLGHKAKTPTSAVKLKDEPENKPVDATPSGTINDLSKDDTSKSSSKSKNAPTRSGRNSKASRSSSKLKEETPKPSSKFSEGTPKSGSQSEVDVVGGVNKVKKRGPMSKKRNKPDLLTPNGASSKGKVNVHENENTTDAQDGTSTKRKKRRARK